MPRQIDHGNRPSVPYVGAGPGWSDRAPVTAKLSREFYEKFGDKIVDELIALFNQVDATYRNELRELNEANFARFDDKLERRLTEFRADLGQRLGDLDGKWEKRLGDLDSKWEKRLGDLRAELIKWMFVFWLGTVATMLGFARLLTP